MPRCIIVDIETSAETDKEDPDEENSNKENSDEGNSDDKNCTMNLQQ